MTNLKLCTRAPKNIFGEYSSPSVDLRERDTLKGGCMREGFQGQILVSPQNESECMYLSTLLLQ